MNMSYINSKDDITAINMKESDIMLSKNGVRIRFAICICLFFLSGSQLITGWMGTICGVVGTIELATAILRYSPVCDLKKNINLNVQPQSLPAKEVSAA
jgi:hypothetical protein